MAEPGPRQNFPSVITAIVLTVGDWIVIRVKAHRVNLSPSFKIKDFDNYEQTTEIDKFPFDPEKGPSYKSKLIDADHPEWRGNNNDGGDGDFTSLYFLNNEKAKDAKVPSPKEVTLEFPAIGKATQGKDIGYYVWRTDNPIVNNGAHTSGPIAPPYVYPEPADKDVALGPNPYNPDTAIPYIGIYNWWDFYGWLAVKNDFANMGLPEPPYPDGNHYGWSTAARRDTFLTGLNIIAEQAANAPIIPNANYPLDPHYKALSFDFSQST